MPRYNKKTKRSRKRRQKGSLLSLSIADKHYYELKGKNAEALLNELAEKTFLTDWCYLNPKLPNGKELCDLLVVFNDTAIIWQVKDVKLKDGHIKESDLKKNMKQIAGAYRQLFELKTEIELSNPRRGKEAFDANTIKDIYLISAFLGNSPFHLSSMMSDKGKFVHTFTRQFTQIALNELDTISDFTKYLREIEGFHENAKSIIVDGGEEELLGFYIKHNRSFDEITKHPVDGLYVEKGNWEDLSNRTEYKAKQIVDEISYYWDHLIDICHTGDNAEYEIIARELANSNRFERRILAHAFLEAYKKANSMSMGYSYRRVITSGDITYCFLFYGDSNDVKQREFRREQLSVFCHIARGRMKENIKVIGIATDQKMTPINAYDYCMYNIPDWTEKDQEAMEQNMKVTGIFMKMKATHNQYYEFPKV